MNEAQTRFNKIDPKLRDAGSGVVPFIITDELKMFYYRGLREWGHTDGYLTDTCLTAQDNYKAVLDYFRIKY